jgi:inosine-uridine nucleoside N-ribohydrolase
LVAALATWGNCARDQVVRNTMVVLEAAGREAVPVHPGCEGPSGPAPVPCEPEAIMGKDGLGDAGIEDQRGAAGRVGGNYTTAAEANIGHDPLAAEKVVTAFGAPGALASGRRPCLLPLDVTLRSPLTMDELAALETSPLAGAGVLFRVCRCSLSYRHRWFGRVGGDRCGPPGGSDGRDRCRLADRRAGGRPSLPCCRAGLAGGSC